MTNYRALFYAVLCVVLVSGYAQNQDELVRDKRTLNFILQAFADSLGYDVQKRPSILPTSGLPKPAAGPRTPVAPPLPPMAPAMPAAPAAPPMMPKAPPMMPPAPPMMPAAPPMMPAAPPMMPKAPPAPPMMPPPAPMPAAPAPMPPPKGQVGPVPPARPRPPTAPPLLTETIQKMFNINFNWNRNLTPGAPAPVPAPKAPAPAPPAPPAHAPAPKAPAPAPPAPAPAPKAPPPPPAPKSPPPPPAPALAPKVPAPAPAAPAPAPKAPAPAPAPAGPPKGTVAPGKFINYDYDDGQPPVAGNLRTDYDGIYYYENDGNQPQQQQEQQEQQEQQPQQPQEEEVNQNEQNAEVDHQADAEKKRYEFDESVQNFWQNSPWHQSNNERYNAESRPGFYQYQQPGFGGHDFVVNHPGGSSYSRMQHKKVQPVQRHEERYEYQGPQFGQYYFPEGGLPQVGAQNGKENYDYQGPNGQVQHGQANEYQGPSFDQYYYILSREEQPKVEQGKVNGKVEVNNNGEKGLKQPQVEAESRPKEVQAPEAGLPVPVHNIYQENQFAQWLSPFEQAGSENSPKKVSPNGKSQNNKNGQRGGQDENPFQYNYEPEHYESDFSAHTIPPPSQQDYSQYNPSPFKLEDELPEKAQIKEEQYGRKYTTVHSDNVVHHTH